MTKKARLQKAREILAKYQGRLGVCLSNEDLIAFMDATNYEFHAVKVMEHPTYKTQKGFINVQLAPGADWTTFSWVNAIKGWKEGVDLHRVKRAMRNSIQDQMYAFANKANLVCDVCESVEYPSVDHVGKSFNLIATEFIEIFGAPKLANTHDGLGWKIANLVIDAKWHKYHEQEAQYRILCRSCNSKFGINSTR